jgi:hypothetical protein
MPKEAFDGTSEIPPESFSESFMPEEIAMFLHVTKVTYLRDYRLRLEFDDDTAREVDLAEE